MAPKQKATGNTPAMPPELEALIKNDPGGGLSKDIIDDAFWLSDPSNMPPPYAGPHAGPPAKTKRPKAKKYAVNLSAEEWSWVQALDRLDRPKRYGDEKPLLNETQIKDDLLQSGTKLSPRVRRYLADWEARQLARKKKGRPATRAYMLSEVDALLLIACESVSGYVQRGMPVKDALEKVRIEWRLSKDRLADAYNWRRPSLRKSMKRL